MLLKNEPTKERELPPEGTHAARCFMIADLGSHTTTFKGEEKTQRKILFGWELPDTQMKEDGKPFVISEKFTASLYEKAKLRSVLKGWRGTDFTPEEELNGFDDAYFLGRACLLGVTHGTSEKTGKVYANISSVLNVPPNYPVPALKNGPFYFSLDDYNETAFSALPEWVQKVIVESPEYKAITAPASEFVQDGGAGDAYLAPPTFSSEDLLTEDDLPY